MTRPGRLCVDTGHRHPDNNLVDVQKTSGTGSSAGLHAGQGIPWPVGRVVKCWIRRSVRPAADYGHISRDSV